MPEAIPRQLKDYERPDGIKPFQEWIYQVKEKDPSTAVKIYSYVDRIQLGNMSNAKLLPGCEGVWELVMDFGPGWRVYFAQAGAVIILLLCGGQKRGQQKDIQTAVEYWREFKRRNGRQS
jgi:putative addiction module killer protein